MSGRYDAVIVGAGPGGSSAAYYLAKEGYRVLLLDKATFPRDKTCGDALTPRALHTIHDMGLLHALDRVGHRLAHFQVVAPQGHAVGAAFPPKADWPAYALTVPRLRLDNMLREHAMAHGAEFQGQVTVTHIEHEPGWAVVQGERKGEALTYRARVVVIATGASPTLLLRLGLLKKVPPMMRAARAYYEGLSGLPDRISLYHCGVPLPGYGWVFPLSESSANIGVGICPDGIAAWWLRDTARNAFDSFVQLPSLHKMLANARRAGPIKGYPLRADFGHAPTSGERILLVGEAAGLVNPLTGDGIDYALESGRLAASHSAALLARGDFSRSALAAYDRALRARYLPTFTFSRAVRSLCVNPLLLNRLTATAAHRPDLTLMLINRVLGHSRIGKRNLVRALVRPAPKAATY